MFESIDSMYNFLMGKPLDGKGGDKDDKVKESKIEIDDTTIGRIADAVIEKLNKPKPEKEPEKELEKEVEKEN